MGASLPHAAEAHAKLEHCLNNSGDTKLKRVATQLGRLRDQRNLADYRLDATQPENPRTVLLLLAEARRAMDIIQERAISTDRDSISGSMREWSRRTSSGLFGD
ncbi:MAG: hypothetical protein AB1505_06110 [Candidatus Latescibacterota bacterium]